MTTEKNAETHAGASTEELAAAFGDVLSPALVPRDATVGSDKAEPGNVHGRK